MVCSRYPKECKHYETVLKRKSFKKLRNNVWESKTKWILTEKADNHYRVKLLYKCINLWVAYLNVCYKKKIDRRIAEAFYEEKLKAKVIAVLKKIVEKTWMFVRICKKKFECNLKYRSWHQWKHYVQKRLKVKEIKALGDRIRQERLTIRFFYLWLFRLNEKRSYQEVYDRVTGRYVSKLKEKYFKFWNTFTARKICQRKILSLAMACYKDKLKEKYFRCWRKYTFQKKRYKYQVTVIKNFYENFLIKNYLTRWFTFYKSYKRERNIFKNNLALNFYSKKVLEKCFKTLRRAREVAKAREEATEKFRDVYVKIYLNLWIGRRTEKIICNLLQDKATKWRENHLTDVYLTLFFQKYQERVEEREKMENVIRYCDAVTIHRAFQGWREAVKIKADKKIQLEALSTFYDERLINKSFEKWKKFVRKRLRKKTTAECYRHKLLSKSMYLWKIYLSETKLKIEKARDFEQNQVRKLLKNVFESWREETKISKLKLNAAIELCNNSRLSKAFNTWKKNTQTKTIYKNRYSRNKTILDDIIVKNTIQRLYEVYLVNQNIRITLLEFKSTLEKRSLSFYFSTWRKYIKKRKILKQNLNLFFHLRANVLVEQYLFILFEKMKNKKVFNVKNELARTAERKFLKRKYFKKWLSFISWKKESILRCKSREKSFEKSFEVFVQVGKTMRRKPIIPDYLKAAFSLDYFQDDCPISQETFRVEQPVNKKLPIIGQNESLTLL